MRHHCRMKPAYSPRNTSVWLLLLAGVSGLAIMAAEPAHAQGEFAVDISDPNVSVDLSVLDDGGRAPQMGAPVPAASSATSSGGVYQAPGPKAPVSTLYIQPSGTFTLPPQTKVLIAAPTPEPETAPETPETSVAEHTPSAQAPTPEAMAEAAPETAPVPPAPEISAPAVPAPVQETAKAEPEPAPAPVEEPTPASEVIKAEPEPAPEPTPAPAVEPAPAPQQDTALDMAQDAAQDAAKAEQTPPPPPQVLSQPAAQAPAAAPAAIDETQTTPQTPARPGSVVVELPPKLEEAQPGVASLPSPTGPLADGDSMRIVFEHDSSKLPSDVRDALKALSERLGQQENLRLQLLAYAGDTNTSASAARRLSLSRALAVRSYLIENGVRSTRIDVRALGNKSTEEVTERVDITVVER